MTQVVYNGIVLRECETKLFKQDIVRDESRTDVLFSRFRIRVESTLVGYSAALQTEHLIQIDANRGSVVQQQQYISKRLKENGKDFYFWLPRAPADPSAGASPDSQTVVLIATGDDSNPTRTVPIDPSNPGPTVLASTIADPDNGPKVEDVQIERIYGNRLFRVSLDIAVCRVICSEDFVDQHPPTEPAGSVQSSNAILSNRWYLTESKDENWKTTRVLQGTLRTRGKRFQPHLFRHLVVPGLLRGYKRVSQNFATDPTDLVLKYRIEDRTEHAAPPQPAIEWSGQVIEAAGRHGLNQVSEAVVRLTGPPGVDKQQLLGAAGQVIAQRIAGIQKDPTQANQAIYAGWLEGSSIIDVIDQPTIEMRVRWRQADQNDVTKLRSRIEKIGEPLSIAGYDPEVWPIPHYYDRSSSMAGVFSCYLQSPCSLYHAVPTYSPGDVDADSYTRPTNEASSEVEYGDKDEDIRVYPAEEPFDEDTDTQRTTEHKDGNPFTFIEISNEYDTEDGQVQLPYANGQIASPNDTCAVIRLHSGKAIRIFRMEATRLGKPPLLPTPSESATDVNGINETRMRRRLQIHNPEYKADAITREFRVLAEYVYALNRPPTDTEKLRMALSPIDDTETSIGDVSQASRLIDTTELFTSSLIEWQD